MKWCVVIPTYNNEKTLEKVVSETLAVTPDVIVVNDGSTDATLSVLEQFRDIHLISYEKNRGKGHALKKGFELAAIKGFQYVLTLDSDGQHRAYDIPVMLRCLDANPGALIVGQRTLPSAKLRKGSGFANRFSNFWFRVITGTSLPDTQSGFRLYPLDRLQGMRFYSGRYEFEMEVLVRAAWKGIPVIPVPVSVYYPEPAERISHYRPVTDFLRISLLNTVFVILALLVVKPFSFLTYLKKDRIRDFINRNILHTRDSNLKITFSVMLGIFMGIIPIWGYQLITAIALAYLLRLNKLIVIVAANISIPPMIPFILYLSYLAGSWILPGSHPPAFIADMSLAAIRENLFQYVVGSVVLAIAAALFFGLFTMALLGIIRTGRKPETR